MNKTELENGRIEAFQALYGVSSQKEILGLFKEDCEVHKAIKNDDDAKERSARDLFARYALAITYLYSLSSIKTNLKIYKKIIQELNLGSIVQDRFYFKGLFTTVSKISNRKIEEKKEEGKGLPFDVKEEIKRVKKILDDKNYSKSKNQTFEQVRSYYISYILGLSTGRRFTEILKTISLKNREGDYYFEGLLKKKDGFKNKQLKAELLELTPREINEYSKEIREYLDAKLLARKKDPISLEEITENRVNTIFAKVYNNAVKRISEDKVPNFHELRHIYTVEHQERYIEEHTNFYKNSEEEQEAILQSVRYRILGHEKKQDTTDAYRTIK